MREFSPVAVIIGVLIGVLFGAANAYIGLKVGMTVSASIPAAVMALAIMRGLLKRNSILESNMVQTIGSVGESLAAGMIFTIPALYIFAQTAGDPETAAELRPTFLEVTVWGAMGGFLGVLFMVPLRRMLIVKEHGKLPYPEGVACAEVLQSGERGGASAKTVFGGLIVGGVYQLFRGLGFWREEATQRIPLLKTEASLAAEPALLGVGYILGARIAGFMLSGAVLGWFVIIPLIYFFGESAPGALLPADQPIAELEPGNLWDKYLRYIGAGAVILGGVVSLFRSLGTIGSSVLQMFSFGGKKDRTDRDIPSFVLLLMLIGIGAAMWYLPQVKLQNIIPITCVIVFSFFFVTVSSRLVGVVGSSSNPISGMTIATVLATSLIVVNFSSDLSPTAMKVMIISVGAIVCISAAIAGDCSQDLKTGYLVKATPWKQQIGELLGIITAIGALAGLMYMIDSSNGFFKDDDLPNAFLAPQANLMKLLVQGVVDQHLPWDLIGIGIAAALLVELLGIPSLPFAVGLYLPLSLSTPIMVGGILRWLIDKRRGEVKEGENPGILGASGLVAGQGLVGVAIILVTAGIAAFWPTAKYERTEFNPDGSVKTVTAVTAVANPNVMAASFLLQEPPASSDPQNTEEAVDELNEDLNQLEADLAPPPRSAQAATKPASTDAENTKPEEDDGEPLAADMFQDWMMSKLGLHPRYGLMAYEIREDSGLTRLPIDESGKRIVDEQSDDRWVIDFWKLLPLIPFGAMVIWLGIIASKRFPIDGAPTPSDTPWGPPPKRPTMNEPDPFGGVDTRARELQPATKPSPKLDYEAWGPARAADPVPPQYPSGPTTAPAPTPLTQRPVSADPVYPVATPQTSYPAPKPIAPQTTQPTPNPVPVSKPPAQPFGGGAPAATPSQPAPEPQSPPQVPPKSAGPVYVKPSTPSTSTTPVNEASAPQFPPVQKAPPTQAQEPSTSRELPSADDAAPEEISDTLRIEEPPKLPPRPTPPIDRGYPKPPPLPGSLDPGKQADNGPDEP